MRTYSGAAGRPDTTRRNILKGGAALAAGAAFSSPVFARATPKILPLDMVVYDERFAAARQFAAGVESRGGVTRPVRGEMHGLWQDDLHGSWQGSPGALAGMTTQGSLFVLNMIASDAGLRLVYAARHVFTASRGVTHVEFGPHAELSRPTSLQHAGPQWMDAASDIVMHWPAEALARAPRYSTILNASASSAPGDTLVTWIMAPLARAI